MIALDPATGHIKWYFQQTPNDPWDYDATNTPVQADLTINGKPRKVFYQAARNGWFYVVDRTNGKLIHMTPFTKVTSVTGYDRAQRIGTVNARPQAGDRQDGVHLPGVLRRRQLVAVLVRSQDRLRVTCRPCTPA